MYLSLCIVLYCFQLWLGLQCIKLYHLYLRYNMGIVLAIVEQLLL